MENLPSVSRIRRAAATLIDLAMIFLIFLILVAASKLLFMVSGEMDTFEKICSDDPNPAYQIYGKVGGCCCLFITWLYFVQMEASRFRGTVGKLATRLQVVNFVGEQISGTRATLRFIVSSLRAFSMFMVGIVVAGMCGAYSWSRLSKYCFFVMMVFAFFLTFFYSGKRGQRLQDLFSRTRVTRRN